MHLHAGDDFKFDFRGREGEKQIGRGMLST